MTERSDPKSARPVADTEHQLNALVEAVTDCAIYTLDADGKVTTWNPGAERIKGYIADEIIGKDFSVFYTDADRRAGRHLAALQTAAHEGRYEADKEINRSGVGLHYRPKTWKISFTTCREHSYPVAWNVRVVSHQCGNWGFRLCRSR